MADKTVWYQAVMTRDIEPTDNTCELGDAHPRTWHLWGSKHEHQRTYAKGHPVLVSHEDINGGDCWYVTDGVSRVARRFNTLAAQKYLRTVRASGKVVLATPAQAASADQTVEYIWFQLSR